VSSLYDVGEPKTIANQVRSFELSSIRRPGFRGIRPAFGGREFATVSSVAIAEKAKNAGQGAEVKPGPYSDIPALMRAELNADSDRDVLIRMQHLARKKLALRPDITPEELADYLALAENCENFEQWLKLRRGVENIRPSRSTVAWVLGTLAIVALLTTGLIAAIAVTVSGL
jgi:hypothetical protein